MQPLLPSASSSRSTSTTIQDSRHSLPLHQHGDSSLMSSSLLSSPPPTGSSNSLTSTSSHHHPHHHHSSTERDRIASSAASPPDATSFAMYPASSESSFSSMASSILSHASSDTQPNAHRRAREQRRLMNRLAVYLPKPLRPIASSPARFCATLAGCVFFMFLFTSSSFSSSSSSELSSSSSPIYWPQLPRAFVRSPDSLPQIVDAPESVKPRLEQQTAHGDSNTGKPQQQVVKRDGSQPQQVVLQDGSHSLTPLDKPATKAHPDKSTEKQGCPNDGLPRGRDVFTEKRPQTLFRDNLRKDTKYLTFGMMNGFTSQFIALANGIYLAKLSDRVPVLPPFASSAHEDRKEAGYVAFSKIYDVPYLEDRLRHPVTDWDNLKIAAEQTPGLKEDPNPQFTDDRVRAKALSAVKREKISCWSLWAAQMPNPGKPAGSAVQHHLGLDIDYWQIPLSFSKPPQDRHVRYWDLVMLDHDINGVKSDHLHNVAQSRRSETATKLPPAPDDHLMCFDTLYYTAATGPQEWWQSHAPVWKSVGRHVRFNTEVATLADEYIRLLLDVDKTAKTPEFISVHIRHGTAKRQCKDNKDCMPQLDGYKRAVNRIREQILEERGVYVRWVIVTTDEKDAQFTKSIDALGWTVVDHVELETRALHGLWWEVVIDAAIQSKGSGFVGTDKSSMSLIAGKRVEEWNKGPWELVKWGKKGAAP